MYYIEIWDLEFPGVILKKFLLPFEKVELAIGFAETQTKKEQGYYLRYKEDTNA